MYVCMCLVSIVHVLMAIWLVNSMLNFFLEFSYFCVFVHLCFPVYRYGCLWRPEKGIVYPLDLELQVIVRFPICVLGSRLQSFARETNSFLNH